MRDSFDTYVFDFIIFFGAAKRITRRCAPRPFGGALRVLNFASGEVVDPALCLSGVRIGSAESPAPHSFATIFKNGAAKRIRTPDPRITNALLYP